MSLSSLAVRRGVTFSMMFLMVLGAGYYALSRLRIDMFPDITFPMATVVTTYRVRYYDRQGVGYWGTTADMVSFDKLKFAKNHVNREIRYEDTKMCTITLRDGTRSSELGVHALFH